MKRSKLLIILLALAIICVAALPVSAAAETGVISTSAVRVNPLYADAVTQQTLQAAGTLAAAADRYSNTIAGAAADLREGLEDRETVITVGYASPNGYDSNLHSEIFDEAVKHTGVPTQGDYLMWHYSSYRVNIERYTQGNITYISFTYNMVYLSSAQQERTMDSAVDSLLRELNVWNASDYQKVCAVYDYICQNITYDTYGLNTGDRMVYTAYAALVDKAAVCQGYASLFYRLMLELDVDARLIAGIGAGGAHGWNIVELSGKYYDLDSTWDASLCQSGLPYEYFLKCDANFDDHTRYDEYATTEFYSQYPMSNRDYDPAQDDGNSGGEPGEQEPPQEPQEPPQEPGSSCGEALYWELSNAGVLHIWGSGAMTSAPWKGQIVKQVMVDAGVTSICAEAFSDCRELNAITLPDSVKRIGARAFSGCSGLTSIRLPSGITEIADRTFYGCSAMTYCKIPDGVVTIGTEAFANCVFLQTVSLSDSVCNIYDQAFAGCSRLLAITLPEGMSAIYYKTFYNCEKLSQVTIPASIKAIGESAFAGCTSLTDIHYNGSKTEWNAMTIEGDNAAFESATVHYAVLTNGWHLSDDGKWYMYENGVMVKNVWRKDSKGWVWLGKDGAMATNAWVRDSKGWCYVGADGYCLTNTWKRDSTGWCYLDSEGSMVKNSWICTNGKWYWVDGNGYMAANKWMKDSKGWVWLGKDGAMVTNAWVRDSKGWCYVGADGYCLTNTWKADTTGWCYLDSEGSMTKNAWVYSGGKWYWINGNGYMVYNTSIYYQNKTYYFDAGGVCINP